MAMSGNERQKRFIQRLKAGVVSDTANKSKQLSAASRAAVIDVGAVAAWWGGAAAAQRKQLCEAIGGRELGEFLDANNDDFIDYLDEVITDSLKTYAASWGYKKIEADG